MIIDLIFLILILFALVKGLRKGFISALFSFAGLFIGLAAALKLSAILAAYLQKHFEHPGPWWPVLAFILVFLGIGLLLRLLASVLEQSMEAITMGWVNKLAGFVILAVLYTLIYSVVLFYARQLDIITEKTSSASRVYPYIQPWGQWTMDTVGKLIPIFRDLFKDIQQFFEQTGNQLEKSV